MSNKIEISDQKRKLVMSIEHDRIWVDPTVSVDETAQAVIDALQEYIVNMVNEQVKKEREACADICKAIADAEGTVDDHDLGAKYGAHCCESEIRNRRP